MTNPVVLDVVIEDQTVSVSAPAASVNVSTISQPFTVVTLEGPPGPRGLPGNNAPVYGEVPTGTQDGTNATFTLANTYQDESTVVFRNGLAEQRGVGYTESSPDIIFTTPPLSSDAITVNYLIA